MWTRLLTYLTVSFSFIAMPACDKQKQAENPQAVENEVSEPTEPSQNDTGEAIEDAAEEAQDELDGNPTTE